jgi:hypothetical protein
MGVLPKGPTHRLGEPSLHQYTNWIKQATYQGIHKALREDQNWPWRGRVVSCLHGYGPGELGTDCVTDVLHVSRDMILDNSIAIACVSNRTSIDAYYGRPEARTNLSVSESDQ